jgi:hypothetical protein
MNGFGQATPLDRVTAALLHSASKLPFPDRVRRKAALDALSNPALVDRGLMRETGQPMTGAERSEIAIAARQPPAFAKGGASLPQPGMPAQPPGGPPAPSLQTAPTKVPSGIVPLQPLAPPSGTVALMPGGTNGIF